MCVFALLAHKYFKFNLSVLFFFYGLTHSYFLNAGIPRRARFLFTLFTRAPIYIGLYGRFRFCFNFLYCCLLVGASFNKIPFCRQVTYKILDPLSVVGFGNAMTLGFPPQLVTA